MYRSIGVSECRCIGEKSYASGWEPSAVLGELSYRFDIFEVLFASENVNYIWALFLYKPSGSILTNLGNKLHLFFAEIALGYFRALYPMRGAANLNPVKHLKIIA